MNIKERTIILELKKCLSEMGGMNPQNPADIAMRLKHQIAMNKASKCLAAATGDILFCEYGFAQEEIDAAKKILEI